MTTGLLNGGWSTDEVLACKDVCDGSAWSYTSCRRNVRVFRILSGRAYLCKYRCFTSVRGANKEHYISASFESESEYDD